MAHANSQEQKESGFVVEARELTAQNFSDMMRYLTVDKHRVIIEPRSDGRFSVFTEKLVEVTGKKGRKTQAWVRTAIPVNLFPGTGVQVEAYRAGIAEPVDHPVDYSLKHSDTRRAINKKLNADMNLARGMMLSLETFPESFTKELVKYSDGITYEVFSSDGAVKMFTTVSHSGSRRLWFYVKDGAIYHLPATEKVELMTEVLKK